MGLVLFPSSGLHLLSFNHHPTIRSLPSIRLPAIVINRVGGSDQDEVKCDWVDSDSDRMVRNQIASSDPIACKGCNPVAESDQVEVECNRVDAESDGVDLESDRDDNLADFKLLTKEKC